MGGNILNKNVSKCLLALYDQFWSFLYWPEAILGNFYGPEASGSLLDSSPAL